MLEVQKYLLNHSLEELKEQYNIHCKEYSDCVILSYIQFLSPKNEKIVEECRGLILSKDFKTVYCKPFTRFYNYNECPEQQKEFSFENSIITEKVDGSLINCWYNPIQKKWCFATRSMGFAEGKSLYESTFLNLVESCFSTKIDYENLFPKKYQHYTFSFELVHPENRVVTNYKGEKSLYFLAIHNNDTGEYIKNSREMFEEILKNKEFVCSGIKFPRVYNVKLESDLKEIINKNLRDDEEGFVCYDVVSNIRVKFKNPVYVSLHRMKGNGLTESRIIELIVNNEYEEYLSYFPEDRKSLINPYLKAYEKCCSDILEEYEKVKDIESQKDFAIAIQENPYKSILFLLRSKKKNIKEIIVGLTIQQQINLIRNFK